jgi:protein tyrosine/serine phosphatase
MYNFSKVSAKLYRSSAPTADDVIWLNKKLGITRIISLDHASGQKISLACKLLGIEHIMLPIDFAQKSTIIRFLAKITGLFASSKKTLIHCLHGKDRTGLAIAIYRCQEDGWSARDAIKEARGFGFCVGLDERIKSLYLSIIKDYEKKEDINSASDIVDASRQSYDDYVGSASENVSWSAYADPNLSGYGKNQPSVGPTEDDGNPLGGFGPSVVGGGTVL